MRTYPGLIIFETVFDNISSEDVVLTDFAKTLFAPSLKVVEADCGTLLGRKVKVDYPLEGRMELETGERFSQSRIVELLTEGTYYTYARTLDTCVSSGGVCAACYNASRFTLPTVGSYVTAEPEYLLFSESLSLTAGGNQLYLTVDHTTYDTVRLFHEGVEPTGWSIAAGTGDNPTSVITLASAVSADSIFTVHYYSKVLSPFMYWLAKTYSGSLLGMRPLEAPPLHVKQALLSSSLPDGYTDTILEHVSSTTGAPDDMLEYASNIQGTLEKALFALALGVIHSDYE